MQRKLQKLYALKGDRAQRHVITNPSQLRCATDHFLTSNSQSFHLFIFTFFCAMSTFKDPGKKKLFANILGEEKTLLSLYQTTSFKTG